MIYGYARVSTQGQMRDGTSLEDQIQKLKDAGADDIYSDSCTGTNLDRPQLSAMLEKMKPGDKLIVTKLDRLSRSVIDGSTIIKQLHQKGISIHVLNMGLIDDSPIGRLLLNVLLAFAEFERDTILERLREGKEVARRKPGYREGRPRIDRSRMDHAMELLITHSYSQVVDKTGISRSTLVREKRRRRTNQ